jgi:hypothetical protein
MAVLSWLIGTAIAGKERGTEASTMKESLETEIRDGSKLALVSVASLKVQYSKIQKATGAKRGKGERCGAAGREGNKVGVASSRWPIAKHPKYRSNSNQG